MDYAHLMEPVARRLSLGEFNKKLSSKTDLRFGNKGSLSVNIEKGVWTDHESNEGGGVLDLIKRCGYTEPIKWLRDQGLLEDSNKHAFQPEAIFDYKDADGKLCFQVLRNPPDIGKGRFTQRRPNGKGWIPSLGDENKKRVVPWLLYRLPELLMETGTVFIPEGEKHVDALRALGLRATCNPGGAGKWRSEYNEFLKDQDVVVLPDNDDVGRKHASSIAASLQGIAKRVRVLPLPGLAAKGDIINWLEAGGSREQLLSLLDDLQDQASPIVICWPGEHKEVALRWRVKDRIAEVGTGLISGQWGTGKTFMALDLAHAVMSRDQWTGHRVVQPCGVLFIAAERPYEIPLRLKGIKIDHTHPFAWIQSCPRLLTSKGTINDEGIATLIQVATIADRRMVEKHQTNLGLIIIDTVSRAAQFPAGGENDPSMCQALMSGLTILSTETKTFAFGLDHMGKDMSKGTRGGSPKEDYSDVVFSLIGKNRNGEMYVTKVSGAGAGFVIPFSLPVVELGRDRDGDPITTCHVAWGDQRVADHTNKKGKAEVALDAALKAIGGLPSPKDVLLKAFYAAYGDASDKSKRNAWARVSRDLFKVNSRGEYVWADEKT